MKNLLWHATKHPDEYRANSAGEGVRGLVVRWVQKGDQHYARVVARKAAELIEEGKPLPWSYRQHIVAALRAESADKVLGFRRGRGKPPKLSPGERELWENEIAEGVAIARDEDGLPINSNASGPGAIAQFAEVAAEESLVNPETGDPVSESVVEACWKRWGHQYRSK